MNNGRFYPLRPIQRRLVDTHFKKAKSTMMNVGALMKLSPVIDMDRLADAINDTLDAHDIFRCRLVIHPETQDICQTFDGEIIKVKVEQTSDEEFELMRKKILRHPYKIINQPLYHIYLFVTPTAKYFYLDFYHAIMDGMSIAILFQREINLRYNGRNIPTIYSSYANFILQEAQISPAALESGHAYWRRLLADFDHVKNLPPVDVKDGKAWSKGKIKTKFKNISEEFFRKSRRNENNFFLAASMLALSKISGNKNIFMKSVHGGRTQALERHIMGLMYDVFPCTWNFENDMTVAEYLDTLMGKIQTELTYKKSLDIVYNEGLADDCPCLVFQKNLFTDHAIIGDTTATVIDMPPNEISAAENSMNIQIFAKEDGMYELFLDYDAGRFSEGLMKKFIVMLDEVILGMQNGKTLLSALR